MVCFRKYISWLFTDCWFIIHFIDLLIYISKFLFWYFIFDIFLISYFIFSWFLFFTIFSILWIFLPPVKSHNILYFISELISTTFETLFLGNSLSVADFSSLIRNSAFWLQMLIEETTCPWIWQWTTDATGFTEIHKTSRNIFCILWWNLIFVTLD